jgi:hypothetical protein
MKNIKYFKEQVEEVLQGREPYSDWTDQKICKHLVFLRRCIMLLETEPREDFLKSEKERLTGLIAFVNGKIVELKMTKERKAEFRKETDWTLMRQQYDVLKLILE